MRLKLTNVMRAAAVAGTGWTPDQIGSCIAWFRADQATCSECQDTNDIASWPDSIGEGTYDMGAVTDHEPKYVAEAKNAMPGIRWAESVGDPGQLSCLTTELQGTYEGTIVVVASTSADTASYVALAASCDYATNDYSFILGIIDGEYAGGNTGDKHAWIYNYNKMNPQSFASTNVLQDQVGGDYPFHIITYESDDEAYNIRVDGVDETLLELEEPEDGSWLGNIGNRDNFTIGCSLKQQGYSYNHTGDICEVIVFSEKLSEANRDLVEQYLSARYDIALTGL